jgi:hypothetical protein
MYIHTSHIPYTIPLSYRPAHAGGALIIERPPDCSVIALHRSLEYLSYLHRRISKFAAHAKKNPELLIGAQKGRIVVCFAHIITFRYAQLCFGQYIYSSILITINVPGTYGLPQPGSGELHSVEFWTGWGQGTCKQSIIHVQHTTLLIVSLHLQ